MKTEYIWEIKVKNTPTIKRKCNRCGCISFYCSNKFRMNAQKRNLDVWLIYRCEECDSTYNLTILSRTKPELIKKELFQKFSENNEELAREYAFSSETGRKNGVVLNYSSVEYEILHTPVSITDLLHAADETVVFRIQTRFEFGLKLSSIVRHCLGLSAGQFNQMVETRTISTTEDDPLKKHKIRNGDTILIHKEKLRRLYTN